MALNITKGDSASLLFKAVDPTDSTIAVPLHFLDDVTFSVKNQGATPGHILQKSSTTSPTSFIIDGYGGTIALTLDPTDTTLFSAGEYKYDVQLTFLDGTVTTLVNDWLTVVNDVTADGLLADVLEFSDITIAHVKNYLGVDPDNTSSDKQIIAVMAQVEAYIKKTCHHDFTVAIRSESPRISNTEYSNFFLKYRPVDDGYGVTLTENGTALVEGTDFYVYKDIGEVTKTKEFSYTGDYATLGYWSSKPGAIQVTYKAGQALTHDVLQVYYELVGIRCGLKTRTYIDNSGIQQAVTLNSLPAELKMILDQNTWVRV